MSDSVRFSFKLFLVFNSVFEFDSGLFLIELFCSQLTMVRNNVNIKIPLRAFLRDTTIIEKDDHYLKEKLEYPMTINLQFNGDIGTEYPYTIYSSFTKINSILSKRTYFKTNDVSGDYDKLLSDDKIVLKGSLVRGKKLHDDDEYPGYEFPLLYLYLIN